jgi:hypothetical protein
METGEVERELEELETRIERLRALYEQYFMGIERLEPLIPRKDVDRRVWVLRREQIRNTGLRFKFQMLIQRYNTFQQYWGRISREIENGTYRRDVVRAAKRVGAKEALTIVGRKRAERYAMLAEEQEPAEAREATQRDEDDIDDEAVTLAPPPGRAASMVELSEYVAPRGRPSATTYVLDDDDVEEDAPDPAPPARPHAPPLVALAPPATTEPVAPVKPAPLGGLPWGLGGLAKPSQPKSDAPAAGAKPGARTPLGQPAQPAAGGAPPRRRVAELAAEMRAQRAQGDASKAAAGQPSAAAQPEPVAQPQQRPPSKAPPSARPRPPTSAKAAAGASVEGSVPKRRSSVHPDEPAPSRRRRSSLPPAGDTGAGHPASRRPSRPPRGGDGLRAAQDAAMRAKAAATAPKPPAREDELPEQRLRQIYAKYVETKRSANESTAGVTYERLADSLRQQAAKLKATNPAKSIDYDVVVKNGKTLLKPIIK